MANLKSPKRIKTLAKHLKKHDPKFTTHTQALDAASRVCGYRDYPSAIRAIKRANAPTTHEENSMAKYNYTVTKDQLSYLNELAIIRGYNRSLDKERFDKHFGEDAKFTLQPTIIHEHIAGVKTDDLHYRCLVSDNATGQMISMLDVPIAIIDSQDASKATKAS